MSRVILPYNPELKERARKLRNNPTFSEKILWKCLKGKQLLGFDFHRQRPIGRFIVDFYCSELLLAIEVDGDSHDGREEYDKERQEVLEDMGVNFLRFTDTEVFENLESVLETIDSWVKSHR